MAGPDPVFVVGVYARNGMEHLGPDTDLCEAGVQFLIHGHCRSGIVGSRGLLSLAVICVANG